MRIVLIQDWFIYYVVELANALAEHHEVFVIARDHSHEFDRGGAGRTMKEFLALHLRPGIQRDVIRRHKADPRGLAEVVRLAGAVRRFRPDVVHLQDTTDWRVILLGLACSRRNLFLTLHDIDAHPGDRRGKLYPLTRFIVGA